MNVKYTAILLLILLAQSAKAQCDYTIDAVVTQHSVSCFRDGIITVTLSGPDVESGNILLTDALYGITSTTEGGNNIAPEANGGIITLVPAGTYSVQVKAMCKSGNKWVSKTSETTVTVNENYSSPDPVGFVSTVKPYKCDSTGAITINISGGLPPYKLTVTNNNGYSQILDVESKGNLKISNLPKGNYTFSLKDNCGYFPSDKSQQLEAKTESFSIDTPTQANCKTGGTIPVTIKEGKPPFSIIVASSGYSDTINVSSTGSYPVENLPTGNYTITVKDDCGQSNEFNTTIDKPTGSASVQQVTSSPNCGTGVGEIRLGLNGGEPFTIDVTSNAGFEGTFLATADTVFSNLKPGDYTFKITDDCNNIFAAINQTIDEIKLDADDNVITTDVEGAGKGSATIKTTGRTLWIIESIEESISGKCTNSYTLPMTVYSPDTTLLDLCAGTYKIIVSDTCNNKDSTTFTINLKPITSSPIFGGGGGDGDGSSNSGYAMKKCVLVKEITLPIDGGSGTYDLFFIKHPENPAATPLNPVFITSVNTVPPIAVIPDLTPGDYEVSIIDADESVEPFTVAFNIDSLLASDFFEEFVYPNVDSANCKSLKARIKLNIFNDWEQIFADALFDVKFRVIGTTFKTDSILIFPLDQNIEFDLPDSLTYKIMRDNGFEIEAIIGAYGDTCSIMIDTIRFDKIKSNIAPSSNGCDEFKLTTRQNNLTHSILCYPYERTLFDNDGVLVRTDIIANYSTGAEIKIPYGKYKIVFTDAEGYQWIDSIEYLSRSYPKIDPNSMLPVNKTCQKYDLTFNVTSVCLPYEWALYDEDKILLKKDTIDGNTKSLIDSLSYNTTYNIIVTSLITKEITTASYFLDHSDISLNYNISQTNIACLPDTAKGYIDIFRNGNAPDPFIAGTKFEFIDGPSHPRHDTLVAVGNEHHFYPFSEYSTVAENVKIAEGIYRFKVTDTCGFADTLKIDYKTYKVVDFKYELKYDCNSATLIPSATVYLGNTKLPTSGYYLRLLEVPALASYNILGPISSGEAIQLSVTGHYKLQLSTIYQTAGSKDICSLDTIDFYYSPEISRVTFDKVDAYLCDKGNGHIEFLVKGGIGNISYTLLDAAGKTLKEETLPKGTPFSYDNAEENVAYKIEFRDIYCSGAGGTEIITVTNFVQDRLIFGPGALCAGEDINLYSDVPAESYLWTFPNGTGTSTLANPVIHNATVEHKGIYNLEITNVKGCLANFSRNIDIDISNPVVPVADSIKYTCLNNSTEEAEAGVAPGYKLIWYDENKVALPETPVYSTAKIDTFRYFVSQYETNLFCYSDTIPVTIIVKNLPDTVVAVSPDICPGQHPKIEIGKTQSGYIYKVYSESGTLLGTRQGAGDSIIITLSEKMYKSTVYFVETVNTHGCASKYKSRVATHVKIDISDLPDTNINASAAGICRETSPTVIIGKTVDLYTYVMFNRNDSIIMSAVADGKPLNMNPEYILPSNDTLYIEIRDRQGCPAIDKVAVPVDVVVPPVPLTKDTLYCVNDIALPLVATVDEGYYIQWHDLFGAPQNTAPTPTTTVADTLVYNITQIHKALNCESDPAKVNITVVALPAAVEAIAQDICPFRFPEIEINETQAGYVYNIYSAQGTLLMTRQSAGDSIIFVVQEPLAESEFYLVETINTNGCISIDRTKVEAEVVNYAYINPVAIPEYERGKEYSFQLETNAVYPYEFTADGLMYGFVVSPTGLISGISAVNGFLDSVPFVVKVMDINGCFAEKDYILKSELFVPEVFTPNGDGKNDVFMKGHKLSIFDRIGLKIYEGTDGWDGKKSDGSAAAPDTYFYTIFHKNDKNKVEKRGHITLIKK
jgi:gliding motility-associated-like protein